MQLRVRPESRVFKCRWGWNDSSIPERRVRPRPPIGPPESPSARHADVLPDSRDRSRGTSQGVLIGNSIIPTSFATDWRGGKIRHQVLDSSQYRVDSVVRSWGVLSTEGTSRPSIKVTDKRLFNEEGDLRDPSALENAPSESRSDPSEEPSRSGNQQPAAADEPVQSSEESGEQSGSGDEHLENPGTLFTGFLDSLVVNAYMALGMVRNPYRTETEVDVQGARQMIDIIEMLSDKTKGNLTPEESRYLKTHLGELKLAFVRRSQSVG